MTFTQNISEKIMGTVSLKIKNTRPEGFEPPADVVPETTALSD